MSISRITSSRCGDFGTIQQAQEHAVSLIQSCKKVYKTSHLSYTELNNLPRCACCNSLHVRSRQPNTSFKPNCSIDELSEVGRSYALFFILCKQVLYLSLVVMIFSCACMIINLLGDRSEEYENSSPILRITPGNVEESQLYVQEILHVTSLVILAILSVRSFYHIKVKGSEFSAYQINAGDFTVMLEGLPSNYTEDEVTEFMSKFYEAPELYDIYRTFNIARAVKKSKTLVKERNNTIKRMANKIIPEDYTNKRIKELKDQQKSLINTALDNVNSIAFVTFYRVTTAKTLLEENRMTTFSSFVDWLRFKAGNLQLKRVFRGDYYVDITGASHPQDIIWENLAVSSIKRGTSIVVIYSISYLILLGLAFLLQNMRTEQKEREVTFSLLISLSIVFINLIIEWVLWFATKFELHLNRTNQKLSLIRKLIRMLLINITVIPIIVNDNEWFERDGLITDVIILLFLSSVVPPFVYFFNIRFLFRLIRQKWASHKLQKKHFRLQIDLNRVFMPLKINISERYAQVITLMHASFFFSPVFPLAVPIAMIGLLMEYWSTKIMLIRYHRRPKPLNERMAIEMGRWLMYSVVSYGLGIIYFFSLMGISIVLAWTTLIFIVLYLCVPVTSIFGTVKSDIFHLENVGFDRYRFYLETVSFIQDFERANPVFSTDTYEKLDITRNNDSENPLVYNKSYNIKKLSKSFEGYVSRPRDIEGLMTMHLFNRMIVENSQAELLSTNNKGNSIESFISEKVKDCVNKLNQENFLSTFKALELINSIGE